MPRRIIPARAGFTSNRAPKKSAAQDHPRSRGVYYSQPDRLTIYEGSSPLARGLRDHGIHHRDVDGIIPARAGFTSTRQT